MGQDRGMKARTAARLAWSLWAVYGVATALFMWLGFLNEDTGSIVSVLPILFAFTAFAAIGALIVSRNPRHPVGWIFTTIGLGTALGNLTQQYAIYALFTDPGPLLPAGVASAWLGGWVWTASMGSIMFLPLLFPTGRPPSPRWTPLLWAGGIALLAGVAGFLFKPGLLDIGEQYPVANPLGVPGSGPLLDAIQLAGVVVLAFVLLGGTLALLLRGHRSKGDERQQLKWFGYAVAYMLVTVFIAQPLTQRLLPGGLGIEVGNFLFGVGIAALPTGAGIAILRHHLYDIDIIINRTLVYGALTAVLALVYVVGVAGVGGLVRAATGQDRNTVVVAASTLAVAALFRPARFRVQAFIDRRFYRRKYDAARTLELFSTRLRGEIDLETLSAELLSVVQDTMQPAQVSLWLRERERQIRQPA
jgi:hypothetical protein